jgi:hypothetical protein
LHLDCVGSKSGIFLLVFMALILARFSFLEDFHSVLVRLMRVEARPASLFVR